MRLARLYCATVKTSRGERLGKVHEVIVEGGRVKEIGVGAANVLERLFGRRRGRHVAWEKVKKIEGRTIIVED
jgi:sporulation protein YlmC with PRC-barrel domain